MEARSIPQKKRQNSITAAALQQKTFAPLQYVVAPILVPGATILAGRPKSNKSWLVLELAVSVASGEPALGGWKTDPGDVLYYALEDNQRRMNQRLAMLRPGVRWPADVTFRFDSLPLSDGLGDEIDRWAQASKKPKLVVIDTYQKVLPPRARQTYASDYHDSSSFADIANKLDVSMLAVHHVRKGEGEDSLDGISGTTGVAAGFDSAFILARSNEGDFVLEGRGRDIAPVETALDFDPNSGGWKILGDPDAAHMSEERKAVLEAVQKLGEAGPKDISDRTGVDHDVVRKLLPKLVETGFIRRVSRGTYAPCTPLRNGHDVHNGSGQFVNDGDDVKGGRAL